MWLLTQESRVSDFECTFSLHVDCWDSVEFIEWHVSCDLSLHLYCLALGLLWNG